MAQSGDTRKTFRRAIPSSGLRKPIKSEQLLQTQTCAMEHDPEICGRDIQQVANLFAGKFIHFSQNEDPSETFWKLVETRLKDPLKILNLCDGFRTNTPLGRLVRSFQPSFVIKNSSANRNVSEGAFARRR